MFAPLDAMTSAAGILSDVPRGDLPKIYSLRMSELLLEHISTSLPPATQ